VRNTTPSTPVSNASNMTRASVASRTDAISVPAFAFPANAATKFSAGMMDHAPSTASMTTTPFASLAARAAAAQSSGVAIVTTAPRVSPPASTKAPVTSSTRNTSTAHARENVAPRASSRVTTVCVRLSSEATVTHSSESVSSHTSRRRPTSRPARAIGARVFLASVRLVDARDADATEAHARAPIEVWGHKQFVGREETM
jgi:hypothetical protein